MAPFLVRCLPQGLQVPPEELHRAQLWHENYFWLNDINAPLQRPHISDELDVQM
jgi:hypothetical protein